MPLLFPTHQEHEDGARAGVAKHPLPSQCTYGASGRARAWWSLPGRTGPPVCQVGTLQFLSNLERTDFGADRTAFASCEARRGTPIKLPTRSTPGTAESLRAQMDTTRKVTFFLRYLHFQGLFKGSIEKAPVRNKEKCDRKEQDPIVLRAVQIQRRHRHYANSGDYKILMAYLWIPRQ